MKTAYFHQTSADDDDHALGAAKVMGYVPTTCLLGGILVWNAIGLEFDPCALCNGPREKCGGREQQPNALASVPDPIEDAFRQYREDIQ